MRKPELRRPEARESRGVGVPTLWNTPAAKTRAAASTGAFPEVSARFAQPGSREKTSLEEVSAVSARKRGRMKAMNACQNRTRSRVSTTATPPR